MGDAIFFLKTNRLVLAYLQGLRDALSTTAAVVLWSGTGGVAGPVPPSVAGSRRQAAESLTHRHTLHDQPDVQAFNVIPGYFINTDDEIA